MENNNSKIAAAFVKAQSEFGAALKTNTNPHFKSKYADLSSVIDAVIDALNKNGIAIIQQNHECESGVSIETVFLHESGQEIRSGKLWLPASKQDAQGYGSALTYARRYSLMAACGIAPEDDDGNAASKPKPEGILNERALADHIAAIKDAADMTELTTAWQNAYRAAQAANDQNTVNTLTKYKNQRKSELSESK